MCILNILAHYRVELTVKAHGYSGFQAPAIALVQGAVPKGARITCGSSASNQREAMSEPKLMLDVQKGLDRAANGLEHIACSLMAIEMMQAAQPDGSYEASLQDSCLQDRLRLAIPWTGSRRSRRRGLLCRLALRQRSDPASRNSASAGCESYLI